MTNAEHLLENAVCLLEEHDPYRAYKLFIDSRKNVEMAALARIPLDVVWEMAMYCHTTLRWEWVNGHEEN